MSAALLAFLVGIPAAGAKAKQPPPQSVVAGSMVNVVDQVGARRLWEQGITGAGVTVAVIDTGVAPVPALSAPDKIVAMVDLSAEADVPEAEFRDTYGHGTHMMGIIAGRDAGADLVQRDPARFVGVAPEAAIVSVKVGDNTGAVDPSQVIAGIDWVIAHRAELGIRVLNLSYGTDSVQPYTIDPLAHAVERAWHAGIVVVVSAGNDGRGVQGLANPASDPYVIAVAGADVGLDGRATSPSWSTSGTTLRSPDLAAPGSSVHSLRAPGSRIDLENPTARVGEHLFKGTGSSQSAAVVSGAAALLLQARPELTPDQVKALLVGTARPFQNRQTRFQGAGLLDVAAAAGAPAPMAVQSWPRSDGSGSLDASRGTSRIVGTNGVPVVGEVTPSGARWKDQVWDGARWRQASWDGARWKMSEWDGARWRGASWTGARWRSEDWDGARWRNADWSGARWRSASWTGTSWTGSSWSGRAWSASTWAGAAWG